MKKVIAYVHTHWDREWYREFEEYRLRLIEVVDKILKDLITGKIPSFYFDGQTAAIEDYLAIYPDKKPLIEKLIKQKKLFAGPFYCLSDMFLVNSESIIRNLKMGIEQSKKWGCDEYIGYLADTFGHSKSIVNILNAFGIQNVMMWRGLGDVPSEFMWHNLKAINLIRGYFQNVFSMADVSTKKKAEILQAELDKIAEKSSDYILLPIGGDHLASPINLNKQIKEINKHLKGYEITLGSPFDYIEKVKNNYKKKYAGEFLDNSKTFVLKGVYSSRIYIKQKNADTQWQLSRIAEPLQAFAHKLKYSKSYQNECDYAYKHLLKNHAHDGIYGCSTDTVHKEIMVRYGEVDAVTNGVIKRAVRDLSKADNGLSIVNLSNFEYNGSVRIKTHKILDKKYNAQLITKTKGFGDNKLYDIHDVPITEDYTDIYEYLIDVKNLQAFSVTPIKQSYIEEKSSLRIRTNSIENNNISLTIDDSKITVTDKKSGKIYSDFIKIIDRADIGDSYNFGALKGDEPISAKLVETKIIEHGLIRAILRVNYEIEIPENSISTGRSKKTLKHKLQVDIKLENQNDYLEFDINWLNKPTDHILQVVFNLPEPVDKTISEDTVGLVERIFDPEYDIYKHLPAPRGIELKLNVAPMQRFVSAQDVCIITKGLQEYEVHKNNLMITILRSTGILSNPKNPTRGTPAGPPLETPDLQCLSQNNANFALCFGKNPVEFYKNAEKFYEPCVSVFSEIEKKLLPDFDSEILVQAVKLDKKDNLVIRLQNIGKKSKKLNQKGYLTTTLEEKPTKLQEGFKISPNEIITMLSCID